MKKINIFDNDIYVKDFLCTSNKEIEKRCHPSLRLYIKVTDSCPCNCQFCANDNYKDFGNLDLNKLAFVISYLQEKNYLHGISITGGEPMTNPSKLNDIINLIYCINPDMDVAISTNGLNFREFSFFDNVNKLESIHLSRHHYLDEVNSKIFGSNLLPSREDIMYVQELLDDRRIININTLVMKGYIDSLKEIKKMLDFTGDIGVYKNGFVSLMKCNDYSEERFINFSDIFENLDNSFYSGHHFYCKEYCECVDGIYLSKNNKLVEYYARMVKDMTYPYTTQLVYTSDNKVTAGFGKKILLR